MPATHKDPVSNADVLPTVRRLNLDQGRRVALIVLGDEQIIADLYDRFLIQQFLNEPGKSVSRREAY